MAEMLSLPAYEQIRILAEQKYPTNNPQSFRVPYYQIALTGIRHYYRDGNDRSCLTAARRDARVLGNQTRAEHNLRVINRFEASPQARRDLTPQPSPRITLLIGRVLLRLSPDLRASEDGDDMCVYYNCRNVAVTPEIGRRTVQIAYHVLSENGVDVRPSDVEYVDFQSGEVYRGRPPTAQTLRILRTNARLISTLWETV